ncbi:MFS transporter [Myceligenerans crystallogenes]|uniref:Na+/melibiose symporter n=1 Tax=Myceligenerans crystallogenes TaxID=316335 RepID=A0ABN2N7G4_9MICO
MTHEAAAVVGPETDDASPPAAGTAASGPGTDPAAHLRTPAFRWLTTGWAATNFADSALTFILAIWIADLTGDPIAGGLNFAMLGLPALASPFLGALADRVSRRKLMAWAYVGGAVVLLPLFWVKDAATAWVIYPVTAVYALVAYVTAAGQSGLLKDLMPDAALGHANARLATIDQVFRVAMPFLGAGVYAFLGAHFLVVTTVAAFAVAAVVFFALRITETMVPPTQRVSPRELADGFRQLYAVSPLGGLTTAMTIALASVGLINGVTFAIMEDLGIPNAWLPPMLVLQGVGGLLAGALLPRMMARWGRARVVAVGLLLAAAGLGPVPLGLVVPTVIAQFAMGFGLTSAVVAYVTERQVVTALELQGRTGAASALLLNFPQVPVTVGAAALLAVWDWRLIVVVNVAALLLCGLAGLRVRQAAPPAPEPR